LNGDEKSLKEFQKEAQKFMDEKYPTGQDRIFYKSWLRIYGYDEEVERYYLGEYSDYEVFEFSGGTKYKRNCSPDEEKTIFSQIFLLNKKIAFCAQYN